MPTADPVITLEHVVKRFGGYVAVEDANFAIERGEFFSLLGPSGCGKTTTLRMIAGFELPTSGRILLDGKDVSRVPPYRRNVNTVFQHYALFPHMTVADNVAFGPRSLRIETKEAASRVEKLLAVVRLTAYADRKPAQLSGGQQQRVALARALVNRPTVLLLDEPLAALDRKLRRDMQIELQNLQRDVGITFILVTHDQEEALSMSDTIAIMRDGRIVQFGSPQQLYDAPVNRYVADFVGESNFLSGKVTTADAQGASVALANGLMLKARWSAAGERLPVGEEGAIAVRPEVIGLWPVGRAPADLDLRRPGQVRNRIYLGGHTEFSVNVPELGELMVRLPKSDPLAMRLQPGDSAEIGWRADQALVLSAT